MADPGVTRTKTCRQCGNDYEWRRGQMSGCHGLCSRQCHKARMAARSRIRYESGYYPPSRPKPKRLRGPTPCEQCGEATKRPRFCSQECGSIAARRRNGERPRDIVNTERRLAAMRTCQVCDKEYQNKTGSKGYCCSRKCGDTLIRWRGECARRYTEAKREFAKWAKPNRALGYAVRKAAVLKRIERKGWVCVTCGAPIEQSFTGRRFYCSKPCRPIDLELKAKHKRIAKAKRRARKRGVNCEPVDPFKVFERDGWICHLCGCKTDRTKRGMPHPKAPELDHVVPLAKGGPHNYANTACACRKCNYTKGDRILGQPSLLAA